jgi:hypothetical protein
MGYIKATLFIISLSFLTVSIAVAIAYFTSALTASIIAPLLAALIMNKQKI